MSDEFDLEREEKNSSTSSNFKKTTESKVPEKKETKFKPIYFFAIIAVATVLWILYPTLFGGSSNNTRATYTASTQTTAQQHTTTYSQAQVQPTNTQNRSNDIDTMLGIAEPPANVLQELNQLKTEVTGLRQDLAALVKLIDANAANTQSNTQSINTLLAFQQQQAAQAEHQIEANTPAETTTANSQLRAVTRQSTVPGFSLNTIYQTQAWIEDANRVYVVRVGDTVGGMKIQRINADTREVFTSRGVIR